MSSPSITLASLVANDALLESIRNRFTAGPQNAETLAFVGGLAAFVVLIILAARYFGREPSAAAAAESQVDYLTLAVDVLGLSESERHDLQRIARQAGLDQPAAMLLSPENLARAAAPTLSVEGDNELRRRLADLCLRLFRAPLPDTERAPSRPT